MSRPYIAPDPEFAGSLPHFWFDVDGELMELPYESRDDVPDFGESVHMDDGRVATRVLRASQPQARQPEVRAIETHFASISLPKWYEHHKGPFDKHGRCLFSSRREVDETVARAQHGGDFLRYDHPR